MLDTHCKTEEVRTTVQRRKRQRIDQNTSSQTLPDLKIYSNSNPVSRTKLDIELKRFRSEQ